MKIVIPMAGRGSRFGSAADDVPKPLVPVAGHPMILWALESLEALAFSEAVFVVIEEHERRYELSGLFDRWATGRPFSVVTVPDVTEGQLCTVLAARDRIAGDDEDVIVASCDTYVRSDIAGDVARRAPECRGIISVAEMGGDHWSFARTDPHGRVLEVAEKVRISPWASTGLYYFSSGAELIDVGDEMVERNQRTRGEFYVIPVYQRYVDRGWRVEISPAGAVWDLGTRKGAAAFEREVRSGLAPRIGGESAHG